MANIYQLSATLLKYALTQKYITEKDLIYMRNKLADFLQIDAKKINLENANACDNIGHLLSEFSQWAACQKLIESANMPYSDLFETKLMDLLVPLPSVVEDQFWLLYKKSVTDATDWFFDFCKMNDYIKVNRIAQNIVWDHDTDFGKMTMTINLSKPEKDPKAIAAAAKLQQTNYPKCMLCKDNIGFVGHLNHPARQTLRTIDITLNDENWFIQYSPYAYFNEHMIAIKDQHVPMLVNGDTYRRLCDFVDHFPHYFIGSNAGLPIVGGSMLAHDHYQAGRHKMPIVDAETFIDYGNTLFDSVKVSWLKWPLTTLRMQSDNRNALIAACTKLQNFWQDYTDPENELIAHTDQPHHAITPILRKRGELYEMDMVLRSNLTTEKFPDGVYHPHREVHPVKKENIGLIEVMGYAILPGRLKLTIDDLAAGLKNDIPFEKLPETVAGFAEIYNVLRQNYQGQNTETSIKTAMADTFVKGLSHAGVIKTNGHGQKTMSKLIAAFKATR